MRIHSKPRRVLLGSFCSHSQRMFREGSVWAKPYWHIQGVRGKEGWLWEGKGEGPGEEGKKKELDLNHCKLQTDKLCTKLCLGTRRNTEPENSSVRELLGNPNYERDVLTPKDSVSITNTNNIYLW